MPSALVYAQLLHMSTFVPLLPLASIHIRTKSWSHLVPPWLLIWNVGVWVFLSGTPTVFPDFFQLNRVSSSTLSGPITWNGLSVRLDPVVPVDTASAA